MQLFDTHAHYDDTRFDPDRDAVLRSLATAEVPVKFVLVPGCSVKSTRAAIALAEQYDFVYAASGVHPHDSKEAEAEASALENIESLAKHPRVKAIGEIGLDYHYDFSPRETQRRVFRLQMEIADRLNLPVIIHDREAHADCLEIVREFPNVHGVYHCYSGSWESAQEILKLGYYISFTGSITFKNAYKVPEVVAKMPADRIMIETDAPYMTPVPHRGKRNDSTYMSHINRRVAELRCITEQESAELTYNNAMRFFGI